MTLDDAIRRARNAINAPSTRSLGGILVSEETLTMLVEHAEAGQALREAYPPAPDPDMTLLGQFVAAARSPQ